MLLPLDAAALDLASEAPAAWAEQESLTLDGVADTVQEVARQTREFLGPRGAASAWGAFLAAEPGTRAVVGTCAYKGPPDWDGVVEIAYFTFPPCEGRGVATAMAGGLIQRAAASGLVRTVRAHTLPQRNASGRVLEKLGFRFVGEVVDPEDGPVWRWERPAAPMPS